MGKASRRKQERSPGEAAPEAVAHPVLLRAPRPAVRVRWPSLALLAPALPVLVGVLIYANSFSIPFLFDDHFGITRSPMVLQFGPLLEYVQSRGLLLWTFALNHYWTGDAVWSYHLVNLTVHLLNSLLVYALVLTTLQLPRLAQRYGRYAQAFALLTALVFVAHPLQTMAVSYISQRAESLASLFYLAALLLYRLGAVRSGPQRLACFAAMLLSALLGVLCKETVVTLVGVVPLYHLCFLAEASPVRRPLLRRVAPYALLLLPLGLALYLARGILLPTTGTDGVPRTWLYIPTAGFGLEGVTPWTYLITQFGVILWYLRLYLLPTRQCFDYGWPLLDSAWRADVILPFLVLVALAAAAVVAYRRYPLATFCIGWFFLTLAPTSSVLPLNDVVFEHRMYLTVVGLSLLLVVGGHDVLEWLARRRGAEPRRFALPWLGVVGAWVLLLGALTVVRNGVYSDPLLLAADSASKSPGNWRPHFELGSELESRKQIDEAIRAYQTSVELDGTRGAPRVQLGNLLANRGRYDDAIEALRPATTVDEESVAGAARRTLGMIYSVQGDKLNAINEFEEAKRLMPRWTTIRVQLGRLYVDQEQWFLAAGNFNEAIQMNPALADSVGGDAAQASYRAGAEFLEKGQPNAAANLLNRALERAPGLVDARYRLALAYAAKQWWGRAEAEIETAARGRPGDPDIERDREWILRMRDEGARRYWEKKAASDAAAD